MGISVIEIGRRPLKAYTQTSIINNCKNCGAPLNSNKCEYCGTVYKNQDEESLYNMEMIKIQQQMQTEYLISQIRKGWGN